MLNRIIDEKIVKKVWKSISQSNTITIISHTSPDGDAVGSSLALYNFLLHFKRSVNVIFPDNFPIFFKWMNGAKEVFVGEQQRIVSKQLTENSDLIFCLDFNSIYRTGILEKWINASCAKKILIDHHPYSEKFCDIIVSNSRTSSTCELIFRLIYQLNMIEKINKSCAECIYVGMMTDTGAFTYNSNQIFLYSIIQKLLKKGICKDTIYNKVYCNYSEYRLRLQGYILYKKMIIFGEYNTALISLSYEEQQRFQYKQGDVVGFVNMPLAIEKVVFSVFIREDEKKIKLSFRSKGNFPTNAFASEIFGGGGHLNAAGGEFVGKLQDAIMVFKKALPRYKKQLT